MLPCLSAAMLVSACNHSSKPETSAVATSAPQHASTSAAGSANTPAALPVPAAMPAPPPHQYAMEQDGTYGYEPTLSEDDVRSGKATKPLVMMRYVGRRDGTYVLLLIDPDNENYATRVTCQAPCNFAKLQTMSGTMVLKTETIRVAPNSFDRRDAGRCAIGTAQAGWPDRNDASPDGGSIGRYSCNGFRPSGRPINGPTSGPISAARFLAAIRSATNELRLLKGRINSGISDLPRSGARGFGSRTREHLPAGEGCRTRQSRIRSTYAKAMEFSSEKLP